MRPLLLRAQAVAIVLCAFAALGTALASSAGAAEPAAWWQIDAQPAPTILQPGHEGFINLEVLDIGNQEVPPPVMSSGR